MSIRRTLFSSIVLLMVFVGGLVLGSTSERRGRAQAEPAPPSAAGSPTDQAGGGRQTGSTAIAGLPDLSHVAERAILASVNISSTKQVRVDPLFQLFYGADAVVPQTSLGSGVIATTDGYVVTNSHVVGDPRADVRVTLSDNRELPATVVGVDPYSDLAVLKVNAQGLSPLPWGDSSRLRVAEWVLAVGNPFSFNQTVTLGIVSAPNRHDPQLATYNDFIQTDAAINRGNSGGALINARGELIGINTLIYSETGGYQGIGFAIPSSLVRRIFEQLRDNGEVIRGSIGNLTLRTITADEARTARLGDQGGAYVENMFKRDPAYNAGILPGDVIVGISGQLVTEQSQFQRIVAEAKIGSRVTVDVIRQGKRMTFDVPVARLASPQGRVQEPARP
jgi:S1-C subfamily serine protease